MNAVKYYKSDLYYRSDLLVIKQDENHITMIRLSEQIAARIKKEIFRRRYKTGKRLLPEVELAQKHGVSRSVIREALKNLESAGLVTIKKGPKGGIFVSDHFHKPLSDSLTGLLDAGRITDSNVFDVWMLLGAHAAWQTAFFAEPADIENLTQLIDIPEKGQKHPDCFPTLREEFHLALARSARNPVIEIIMTALTPMLKKYFHGAHDVAYEKATLISFQRIVGAIESRDPESAKILLEEHINRVREFIHRSGQ